MNAKTQVGNVLHIDKIQPKVCHHFSFYLLWHKIQFSLVLSADILCKQFGPRTGPTNCRVWSGSRERSGSVVECLTQD